ncbi:MULTISPECIES: flagellar protein FlgN [unclassified Psychrobacillus]|uniref:flagellar protein FlgN n=1 Tax=unclassified Psychrobacillus TaxID=2636677 RepID=UPI001246E528|nr:flagellar protein FlgN [Psychrobacillus sp. AK 1817]QEY20504.1 flagellar protein FlgN [Psychrobacillus sp. AK 1817]
MSIDKILHSLTNLNMLHKSLLEIAYKKTEAIKTGDMDSLNQLLKDEQAHVAGISQLEQQRQLEVTDYLRAKGIAPIDNPTVVHVLENTNTEEEKEQLSAARKQLLLTLETLKNQNDLNQKLTLQSLQFVNLTLDMLKPKPDQINYSKSEVRGPSKDKTYFDSQA